MKTYAVGRIANGENALKIPTVIDVFNNSRGACDSAVFIELAQCPLARDHVFTQSLNDGLFVILTKARYILPAVSFLGVLEAEPIHDTVRAEYREVRTVVVSREVAERRHIRHWLGDTEHGHPLACDP